MGHRGSYARLLHFEPVATGAVTHIEMVPHNGKEHGMTAIEQLAILDRLKAHLRLQARGPTAIPAGAVTRLRLWGERLIHVDHILV